MSRQCMRIGCVRNAVAALTHDASHLVIWLDPVDEASDLLPAVCEHHAGMFRPPLGWTLCDRRVPTPPLWTEPDERPLPTRTGTVSTPPRPSAHRRATHRVPPPQDQPPRDPDEPTLFDFPIIAEPTPSDEAPPETVVPPPQPPVRPTRDTRELRLLGKVYDADEPEELTSVRSPLLARAFLGKSQRPSVSPQPTPPASETP